VLYAVFDPVRVCMAGHFPPVVALPGQPAELASIATGLMIGVSPDAPRHVTTLPIPAGALLYFYTDGLIERPGQLIDDGLERLRRVVAAQPPEAACAEVMGELVGSESARDDIALLIIRRRPD
jgi:serine phosphatase RsbU (regulator of sigma subunit)